MSFNYRDNTTAYISCLMEFTQRNSKTNFRKIFTSSLSCIDFQFSLSQEIVDVDELPCQLICNIGDLLQEPTEGSVGVCTGSFCDFGGSIGIKITVTNINEYSCQGCCATPGCSQAHNLAHSKECLTAQCNFTAQCKLWLS